MKRINKEHYEWICIGYLFTFKKNKKHDVWEVVSGDYENYHEDKYYLTAHIMKNIDRIKSSCKLCVNKKYVEK